MTEFRIPSLQTKRLTLRGFTPDDHDAYAAMRADPDVVRFLPGGEALVPFAGEIAASRIRSFIDGWRGGAGVWAVEETASGTFIGYAGLARLDRSRDVEVLYGLATPYWGRGYAREAARAAVDYGFSVVGLDRIVAFVVPGNVGSTGVLEAIGMRARGDTTYGDLVVLRYALTAGQWRAGR